MSVGWRVLSFAFGCRFSLRRRAFCYQMTGGFALLWWALIVCADRICDVDRRRCHCLLRARAPPVHRKYIEPGLSRCSHRVDDPSTGNRMAGRSDEPLRRLLYHHYASAVSVFAARVGLVASVDQMGATCFDTTCSCLHRACCGRAVCGDLPGRFLRKRASKSQSRLCTALVRAERHSLVGSLAMIGWGWSLTGIQHRL